MQGTVAFAVLVLVAWHSSSASADAVSCLNACSSRCYHQGSQAAQSACTQACTSDCIAKGNRPSAPAVRWGAIFVAKPPGDAIGWSYNAANSATAQAIAASRCAEVNHGACSELITYFDKCGVAVYALDAGGKVLGVYGKARPAVRDAEASAVAECRGRFKLCKTVRKTCSHGGP